MNIEVYKASAVASVFEKMTAIEVSRINRKAKEQCVWFCFFGDKVRIQARYTRTTKVPVKALRSSGYMLAWIDEKIDSASKSYNHE